MRIGLVNSRGYSLAEVLIACAIISAGLLTLPGVMKQVSFGSKKSRGISSALALEAAILMALQNEDTFAAHRSTMISGATPTGLTVSFEGKQIAQVGQVKYFDLSGKSCAGLDAKGCALKVELDVRCVPGSPYSSCDAAYRISSDPKITGIPTFGPFGVTGSATFTASDYFVPIPSDLYIKRDSSSCDPSTTIAISGFNRDTGEAYCISKPTNRCPDGTIAKGLTFVPDGSGRGGRFEFACTTTFQTLTCPANYSLMSFSPRSLEPGQSKSGTCVWMGQNTVPWRNVLTGQLISEAVCPVNYRSVASCGAINPTQTNGTCYNPCPCGAGYPPGSTCTCGTPRSPIVGSCGITHQGDQRASCSINYPAQSCNAVWDATCQMSGTCERLPAETVSAG